MVQAMIILETHKRDRKTGLSTVQYRIAAPDQMTINDVPLKVFHIHLECDIKMTPWCDNHRVTTKPHPSTSSTHPPLLVPHPSGL
ncbi:B4GALT7 [Cordylochernes scorpioides]|uniref:B4GALT7 n=1 Tax=Cordylochernes scorpioides TaxID=51811 RepID=A0ABY6KS05_9ARAC|nr:B4GALT7 [Cordylochernes scorpioides]